MTVIDKQEAWLQLYEIESVVAAKRGIGLNDLKISKMKHWKEIENRK
jgi:hypothetical protein